jgi:hypothetical protein
MRKVVILGLFLLSAVFVFGGFLASIPSPAHAVTYEAQCTTDGGKLHCDGVGLRGAARKCRSGFAIPRWLRSGASRNQSCDCIELGDRLGGAASV